VIGPAEFLDNSSFSRIQIARFCASTEASDPRLDIAVPNERVDSQQRTVDLGEHKLQLALVTVASDITDGQRRARHATGVMSSSRLSSAHVAFGSSPLHVVLGSRQRRRPTPRHHFLAHEVDPKRRTACAAQGIGFTAVGRTKRFRLNRWTAIIVPPILKLQPPCHSRKIVTKVGSDTAGADDDVRASSRARGRQFHESRRVAEFARAANRSFGHDLLNCRRENCPDSFVRVTMLTT
jgi:hypothetical protein